MTHDGATLKAFIEAGKLRPVRIYKEMRISKQAFYSLYKSKEFEKSTIDNLERVLKISWVNIKKVNLDDNVSGMPLVQKEEDEPTKMKVIERLTETNARLSGTNNKLVDTNTQLVRLLIDRFAVMDKNRMSLAGSETPGGEYLDEKEKTGSK